MSTVYLIHLDSKIANIAHHYIGYTCLSVEERFERHKSGNGARMLQVANERNIDYHVVRTWECATKRQARNLEIKLKSRHNAPKLCPICHPRKEKNT